MTRPHRKASSSHATLALTCMVLTTACAMSGAACAEPEGDLRLSRYTTISAFPDAAQLDPLEAVVQLSMPRASVETVGDAMRYLLLRTGYRLGAPQAGNAPPSDVLSLPLPEVHRQLGPYSVRTAISVLLGTPFTLTVDPAQRVVSYRATSPVVPSTDAPVAEAPRAARALGDRAGSAR